MTYANFSELFLQFYSELFDIFTPNFLEALLRTFREMPVLRKKSDVFTYFLRKLILFSIFVAFCFQFLRYLTANHQIFAKKFANVRKKV